jgi:hypothetical protein
VQHINVLEVEAARVGLSCLSRLLSPSSRDLMNARVLWFSDSHVLVDALSKGRTSSRRLASVVRPLSALLLACSLSVRWVWIPSASNPADSVSREWSEG